MEIIEDILQSLDFEESRCKIKNAMDLANFILDRCGSNMFDSKTLTSKRLRFLEIFDESINDLVSAT